MGQHQRAGLAIGFLCDEWDFGGLVDEDKTPGDAADSSEPARVDGGVVMGDLTPERIAELRKLLATYWELHAATFYGDTAAPGWGATVDRWAKADVAFKTAMLESLPGLLDRIAAQDALLAEVVTDAQDKHLGSIRRLGVVIADLRAEVAALRGLLREAFDGPVLFCVASREMHRDLAVRIDAFLAEKTKGGAA